MNKEEPGITPDKEQENDVGDNEYVLHLYITGASANSLRAVSNLKHICESYIKGRYRLEIIDVYQNEALAAAEQLVALPLLIKTLPLPLRRLIGDMSDEQKVLRGLGLIL